MAVLRAVARLQAPRGIQAAAAAWCLVCGLLLVRAHSLSAQTAPSREYQVKAVFLFNFAQFVEWPRAALAGADTPLVIGVLGENPFGAYLDETVRDEKVDNRLLEVQRYNRTEEIKTCHILFVSRCEATRLEPILASLKERSILVVGDADDFVQRGGMIRLATTQNNVRLIANVDAAKAENLTLSSKRRRSAELFTPSKK